MKDSFRSGKWYKSLGKAKRKAVDAIASGRSTGDISTDDGKGGSRPLTEEEMAKLGLTFEMPPQPDGPLPEFDGLWPVKDKK